MSFTTLDRRLFRIEESIFHVIPTCGESVPHLLPAGASEERADHATTVERSQSLLVSISPSLCVSKVHTKSLSSERDVISLVGLVGFHIAAGTILLFLLRTVLSLDALAG
jgi:hypothetical protein